MRINWQSFTRNWLLAVLLLAAGPALASTQPPDQMLESVTQQMMGTLKAKRAAIDHDPVLLFQLVDQILVPHVDTQLMARLALGAAWRQATEQQRERFTAQFKTLMVRFYVSALMNDPKQLDALLAKGDELIKYQQAQMINEKRSLVRATVTPPDRGPVPVAFRLHSAGDQWLVYDLNVDGVSVLITYRDNFKMAVARDGLDKLIADLEAKNKTLWDKATGEAAAGSH